MDRWLTAREISAAGVAGLPTMEHRIRATAARHNWIWRARAGRGGGREYDLHSIEPVHVRMALAIKLGLIPAAEPPASPAGAPAAAPRPVTKATVKGDARRALALAYQSFAASAGAPLRAARRAFAEAYNAGQIEVESWVREVVPRVGAPTLETWRQRLARGGPAALDERRGRHLARTGVIDRNPEIRDLVVSMIQGRLHVNDRHILDAVNTRYPGAGVKIAAVRRFRRRYVAENAAALLLLKDPDRYRGSHRVSYGSASEAVVRLNQLWELDSTPADVMLRGEDGALRRHAVVGCIDVFSRRFKVLVSPTSRAAAISVLLRDCMLAWGVPEAVKTDGGSDYVSRHIGRVLAELGIVQQICPPFSPWLKPHIESGFRTLSHGLFAQLPGFAGHSVADAQALRSVLSFAERFGDQDAAVAVELTPAALQASCDEWIGTVYERAAHAGLGGLSPFRAACEWGGTIRKAPPESALAVLLAEAPSNGGIRVLGKKGISVDGAHFIAPELGGLPGGARVHVRYHPRDLGRIYVFDANDGAFVAIAECPERTGIDRRAVTAKAQELRRQVDKAVKAEARRLKAAIRPERIIEERIAAAAAAAANVVALPHRGEAGPVPAAEAAAAFEAGPPEIRALSPEEQAIADRRWAEIQARSKPSPTAVEDGVRRLPAAAPGERPRFADDREFAWWLAANPHEADEQDAAWLAGRLKSVNFRLWTELDEEDGRRVQAAAVRPRTA